jgi:hypothetical protein
MIEMTTIKVLPWRSMEGNEIRWRRTEQGALGYTTYPVSRKGRRGRKGRLYSSKKKLRRLLTPDS